MIPRELAAGEIFAGYRIERLLGAGGMGVVYLAEHLSLSRKVALKVLPSNLAEDGRFRERFVRESQLAASLDHPNVVPIYEAGERDGRLFIAMRFVEGTDLRSLLESEGRLDPARAVRITGQVAGALDAAHDRGLVHRDVKPANILLARAVGSGSHAGEHVYLSDFGLTKRSTSVTGLTQSGQFIGTMDYAAPEQFEGKRLDGRADVYSLGCVLFECLTGRRPFVAENQAALLYAHLMQPPPKPTAGRADLPDEIDQVVATAMAKKPEERYATAGDLAVAAASALGLQQDSFRPARVTIPRRWIRRVRRHPLRALMSGVAVALVIALIAAVAIPVALRRGRSTITSIEGNAAGLIDLATGRITASVPVGASPDAIASGGGSVWVANAADDTVSKIDPGTLSVVDTIPVGHDPTAIAFGSGAVWVTAAADRVLDQIDPKTDRIVRRVPIGEGAAAVAEGQGFVWVADSVDDEVLRVDAVSGKVVGRTRVGSAPSGIAVGDSVWVANAGDNTVSRIAPETGSVIGTVDVGSGPSAIAATPSAIWVANSLAGTVSRIDPTAGVVKATIGVGDGPSAIVVAGEAVWVSNQFGASITRIDPRSGATTEISVGNRPVGAVAVSGGLWISVQPSQSSHRGGTLIVVAANDPNQIDPASAYLLVSWQVQILTHDGLVAFERTGGLLGSRLVPDLATSLPTPTDGGRTYTFQLRPGIQYSTGALVKPEDIRTGLERSFQAGPAEGLYFDIVGADVCKQGASCDLSRGIVTDDASGTITFHLVKPDADFLYKLALTFASAVPDGTPYPDPHPVPGTGPYMIGSYQPNKSLQLVRNPQFHEWSAAAQPQGFPDSIDIRFGASPRNEVTQVEHGSADFMDDSPPSGLLPELTTRYAGQVHDSPQPATLFMWLNTRQLPFDRVLARQAVNFAVDRARLVRLFGGTLLARPTCQVLPPNMAGYVPYCPYTVDAGPAGRWTGPDLAKARELVARSGTLGASVHVWQLTNDGQGGPGVGRYLVSVLNALGYHAALRAFPATRSGFHRFAREADSSTNVQAAVSSWYQDYPAPSDFINVLLSCSAFVPESTANLNEARFCDPSVQKLIDRALQAQTVEPSSAPALWARADHAIVDEAPWVPLVTPLGVDFVSARVGNYQRSPQFGVLLDQLWVR